jgi:hypothetical protein
MECRNSVKPEICKGRRAGGRVGLSHQIADDQLPVALAPDLRAMVYGPRPDCVHSDALRHRDKVPAPFGYRPKIR